VLMRSASLAIRQTELRIADKLWRLGEAAEVEDSTMGAAEEVDEVGGGEEELSGVGAHL
jgi:hypothetical protein